MNAVPRLLSLPILARQTRLDQGTLRRAVASGRLVPDALAEAGLRRPAMPLFAPSRVAEIARLADASPRLAA
jgi:hypothetical protein